MTDEYTTATLGGNKYLQPLGTCPVGHRPVSLQGPVTRPSKHIISIIKHAFRSAIFTANSLYLDKVPR
jgi:hypothetical protein